MSDLESRIRAIEKAVSQIQMQVADFTSASHERNTQRQPRQRNSMKTPQWATNLMTMLTQLHEDLQDVKSSVTFRSSTVQDNELAKDPGDAIDMPSTLRSGQRPSVGDLSVQIPTSPSEQALSVACQRQAGDVNTTMLRNDSPPVDSGSSCSPLTDIGSDVEAVYSLSSPTLKGYATRASTNALPNPNERFTLSAKEMGKSLVPHVARFIEHDSFDGKIQIKNLPQIDWGGFQHKIKVPKDYDVTGTQYFPTLCLGQVNLFSSKSAKFKWPDLSRTTLQPTIADAMTFVEQIVHTPPKDLAHYYVGPQLTSDFEALLHPGDELAEFPHTPGVNSTYNHVGESGSGTAFHHEDALFLSCNLTLFGWKIWIIIREHHTEKFETFVKSNWRSGACDQFVRHHSILIAPSRLSAEEIEFDIHCAGPGDMIITKPRQYHAVVNFSSCYAISTNFLLPGQTVVPKDLSVCRHCGLYPLRLEDETIRSVRLPPAEDAKVDATKKAVLPRTTAAVKRKAIVSLPRKREQRSTLNLTTQAIRDVEDQVKGVDRLCRVPVFDPNNPSSPKVFKLAMVIWSRPAMRQFLSLAMATRKSNAPQPLTKTATLEERIQMVALSDAKSDLQRLHVRLNQLYLAQEYEDAKAGCIRADPDFKRKLYERVNWSKSQLKYHLSCGNAWRRISGPYEGILSFIFLKSGNPFGIKPATYIDDLKGADLEMFHLLLNHPYTDSICSAGRKLQESLSTWPHDPLLDDTDIDLEDLSEGELLSCLPV